MVTNKEKLEDFIDASELDEDDIIRALFEIVRTKSKRHLESLINEICPELAFEGYIIYKTDTQKENMQIVEAIQAICPGLRDQESKLFA
jgi:hypothetical protein